MIKNVITLFALVFILSACSNEKTDTVQSNNANLAPSFDLMDIDGDSHRLEEYAGKKVYIKFWASWCPICLSGLEEINTLASEDTDFVVLTVVAPGYNNEKESEDFIKWFKGVENVSTITVLLDEGGTLTKDYHVRGYPTSVFIDEEGEMIHMQPGHLSNEQIKTQFN